MTSWRLLQLADAAFPSGGFAHSSGLEAAMQARELCDAHDLRLFAELAPLSALDARADAFLGNHIANRQSRTQGRALLATAAAIFPDEAAGLRREMRAKKLCLHLAPLSGALYRALGLGCDEAQRLHLYGALRGVLSAAVRLGLAGTHEAQSLQASLEPALDQVLAACAQLGPDELAQTAPLADLFSAAHDRLYSRLFQS